MTTNNRWSPRNANKREKVLRRQIAEYFDHRMEDLDLTRPELGRFMRLKRASVHYYFSCTRSPNLSTLVRYADALGLEMSVHFKPKPTTAPGTRDPLPYDHTPDDCASDHTSGSINDRDDNIDDTSAESDE